jgi:hypothetical protein
MARRNTQRSWSNAVAKSNVTSQSMRLLKEMEDMQEEEEIPSGRSEDEDTETPHPSSKSSSRPQVSLYPVA